MSLPKPPFEAHVPYELDPDAYLAKPAFETLKDKTQYGCALQDKRPQNHFDIFSQQDLILFLSSDTLHYEEFSLVCLYELSDEVLKNIKYFEGITNSKVLLVTEFVNDRLAQTLIEFGINYLDIAGNLNIKNDEGLSLQHKGQPWPKNIKRKVHNGALQPTGLEILFKLLINENLIYKTHADIATLTGRSTGAVNQTISNLLTNGYIWRTRTESGYQINKSEAYTMWLNGFRDILRPKILKGRYSTEMQGWQTHVRLPDNVYWGGAVAASFYTKLYNSKSRTILYCHTIPHDIIKNYKLKPDPNGDIEILKTFWSESDTNGCVDQFGNVHPVLIIADLLKDDRGTARILYEMKIADIIKGEWP